MISKLFSSIGNILSPLSKKGVLGGLPDTLNNIAFALNSHTKNTNEDTVATEANTSAYLKNMTARTTVAESTAVLTTAQKQELINKKLLTAENYKAIASELNLETTKSGNIITTRALTAAEVEEVLAKQGITGVNAQIIASNMGLTTSYGTLTASIGAATKAIIAFLTTNPVGWLIAAAGAIGIGVTAYNALTDSAEETAEKVQELKNAYNDEIQSANSNADTIEELASRYEELSKGVNRLGENVSLTTDEYNEYVSLVNQIADMFPELIQGYDDEGNAILSVKGNVEELRDAYKEAQKEAYNLLIAGGEDVEGNGNDIIKDFNNKVFKSQTLGNTAPGQNNVGLQDTIDILKEIQNITNTTDFDKYIDNLQDTINISGSDYLKDAFKDSGLNELIYRKNGEEITNADLTDIKDNVQAVIQAYESEIDSALSDVQSLANAYLMTNDDYSKLDDELQSIVSVMINSIDLGIASGFKNKTDVGAYVQSVLNSVKNSPEMQDLLTNLFTIEDQNISPDKLKATVDSYINILADYLNEDANILKIRLGFEDIDELESRYSNAIQYTKELFGTDETAFFENNSINTTEEIDNWLEVAKACNTAAEAKERYLLQYDDSSWDMLDTFENLDTMNEKMSTLDETFSKLFDADEDIGFEDYSSLFETFGDISGLDISGYINQLQQAGENTEQVRTVMEALITDYIECSGVLDNLNESNAAYVASMLEEMGVANAQQIVYDALNGQLEAVALEKEFVALKGYDLANATLAEINAFVQECTASEQSKYYLAQLALQKLAVNNTTIDTVADINNIISLANAAMASSEAIAKLERAKAVLSGGLRYYTQAQIDEANNILTSVENGTFDYDFQALNPADYMPEAVKGTQSYSAAQDAAKDATDALTKSLEEQKKALEDKVDALEDDKEALEDQKEALEDVKNKYDELYDAIQWFFDEQIDGFDDLIDNLNKANDALQEQLDGLDDILAVVNNVYGDEIDLIQEKIDALDEANDAAERELALEEARQKLEEARNSRTILQYTADRGYIYTTDEKAIKEAEDEVDEANAEKIKAELEDQIKLLEEMRDKWGEIPDAFEKAMQEMAAIEKWGPNYKDFILGSTEDDIADFEGEYSGIQSDMEENNNQIDYYEKEKEKIEELKELWEDAKNAYENAQNEARLAAFFGSDYEYELLNNSSEWSAKFAENYSNVSAEIDALDDAIDGLDDQIEAVNKQIEELEKRIEEIKNSASGRIGGAGGGGGVGGSGRGLSAYIWTEEDDHAISMGHAMLNQLNAAIDDGKIKYQESADALANYLETYEGFKNGEKSVEDLNTALAELNGVEQEYLGSYTGIIDKTTERLNDASNYTGQIVDYSATATLSFDNLNTAMDTSASNMDNINSGANDFTSQLDQNVQDISGGLDTVSSLMGDVVIGRNQLEGEVAESIFNTGQVAEDSANNVRTVGDAIKDVTQGTQGINDAANTGMTDVSTAAANATTNVTALGNALGNLNTKKQETVEVANDEINKASSAVVNAATNVTALSNAMANLTTEKQELEGEVNEEITDVGTSVTESVEKITLLKDALSGLDLAKQELETTINSEVLDADTLVTEAQTKVTNINNAVNQLITVIEQLKIKLNELHSAMSMLDQVTLSNIIGIIGFGADDEEASLLGAIQAVINKIIGEEGLVYQLQAFNENTDLTPVITQFNGEEASLLSSIQDVINIISVDDNSPCLITTINRITETIQNINLVQGAFANLEGQVQSCVDKVNDLKEAIDKLEDKTITITTNYVTSGAPPTGLATGTANTGRGFATGTANTAKTGKSFLSGNWGLPYDLPKSMIAELGPEILLRDGIYKLIDKPQFIDLKKGDIIFNHEQTEAILKRGKNSNLKRLSELGNNAISKLTGRSFANGFTMVPYKYPEAFNKLYNSDFMDVASKLLPRNIQGFDSKAFDSVKDVKLTKDYHFGDIKINMYGVNDTQSFAVEIKKNLNSILRQID